MRARLEGPLGVGAGPVAELGSGCCWRPGEHPSDRWDKSVASETRSAGSCGEDGRFHSDLQEMSRFSEFYQTTRPTSSTMKYCYSSDHIKGGILYHVQAIYFYNFTVLNHYFSRDVKEILRNQGLKCVNQCFPMKVIEMNQIQFLQIQDDLQ